MLCGSPIANDTWIYVTDFVCRFGCVVHDVKRVHLIAEVRRVVAN